MSVVIVVYTALGGLQAVVYTDTIQWIILFVGLIGFGIPLGFVPSAVFEGLRAALPAEYFSLTNVSALQFVTWMVTIVPIWFIAMTSLPADPRVARCRHRAAGLVLGRIARSTRRWRSWAQSSGCSPVSCIPPPIPRWACRC